MNELKTIYESQFQGASGRKFSVYSDCPRFTTIKAIDKKRPKPQLTMTSTNYVVTLNCNRYQVQFVDNTHIGLLPKHSNGENLNLYDY